MDKRTESTELEQRAFLTNNEVAATALANWTSRLPGDWPIKFMPFRQGAALTIMVAARDGQTLLEAWGMAQAFLGSSYADIPGVPPPLRDDLPEQKAFRDSFGENSSWFIVPDEFSRTALERLEQLATLLEERPPTDTQTARPTGRVLAEFEQAIERRDRPAIDACIDELWAPMDPLNLAFLRIRSREVDGDWSGILEDTRANHLLDQQRPRCPRRVRQAVLKAYYHHEIGHFEKAGDAAGALEQARSLSEELRSLVQKAASSCREASLLSFLGAVAEATSRKELPPQWREYGEEADSESWESKIFQSLPTGEESQPETTTQLTTEYLVDQFRIDPEKWESLLASAPADLTRATLAIESAVELEVPYATSRALEIFDELSQENRDQVLSSKRNRRDIEELKSFHDDPGSWDDWFERLAGDEPWPEADNYAREHGQEWPISSFETILDLWPLDDSRSEIVRSSALKPFLNTIEALESPPRVAGKLLESLWELHYLDDRRDRYYFDNAAQIFRLLKLSGLRPTFQEEIYENLLKESLVEQGDSYINSLLVVWEELLDWPGDTRDNRQAVFQQIVAYFNQSRRRTKPSQFESLQELAERSELELPPELIARVDAQRPSIDPLTYLKGKVVALYSLDEGALQRVADWLSQHGAITKTFAVKHGGNESLREAARTADIFVVATAAAQHSATNFINDNRGDDRDTLFPDGKGSSSMQRKIAEHCEEKHVHIANPIAA